MEIWQLSNVPKTNLLVLRMDHASKKQNVVIFFKIVQIMKMNWIVVSKSVNVIWRKKILNLRKRKCNLFFTQLAWHQTIYAEMVQLALFQTKFVMELWIVKIAQMNSTVVSLFLICTIALIMFYLQFGFLSIFYISSGL